MSFKVGVLASGGGSNLQALLDRVADRTLPATIVKVVSNVPASGALGRAARAGVPAAVIDHRAFPSREAFDQAVVDELRGSDVELVVLAGFMRVLTPVLLDAFRYRVVNVHPALLPAFPGMHGARQALDYGVRVAGCTVHLVDQGVDTGPILAQATVNVLDDDDEASLVARIQAQEHRLLPEVVRWFAEGRVSVVLDGGRPRARIRGEHGA
jgi:phosphoribosylglycinamide formyltransferase-1